MILFDWLQEKHIYNLTISGNEEDAATVDLDIIASGGEITVISEGE
mgnify:CR=1 FL=1